MILARLKTDMTLADLIGQRIYDKAPLTAVRPYVTFGPLDWNEDDSEEILAREITQQIDVWSAAQGGKFEAYRICDAIKRSLHQFEGSLTDNALVEIRVPSGRVMDDPDGTLLHGVLTVTVMIEEA